MTPIQLAQKLMCWIISHNVVLSCFTLASLNDWPLWEPAHRCYCLWLGDHCVFQTLLGWFDLGQQCPGELEALHRSRLQCMLRQPPSQCHQQGAVNLLEVYGQSLWAQYDLPAWQGALWHNQRAYEIPQRPELLRLQHCHLINFERGPCQCVRLCACVLDTLTSGTAGQLSPTPDPDGWACWGGHPGYGLWPRVGLHCHGDPVLAGKQQACDSVMGALQRQFRQIEVKDRTLLVQSVFKLPSRNEVQLSWTLQAYLKGTCPMDNLLRRMLPQNGGFSTVIFSDGTKGNIFFHIFKVNKNINRKLTGPAPGQKSLLSFIFVFFTAGFFS